MFSTFKNDAIAGFSVFLLALPLCLGIAMASNFPPIAGVISAIVGGLIASWFGGAKLSIKGPAAGLIIIALGAVEQLGYERTLAIGVVAAIIQIIIGTIRKASFVEIMPPAVIHGILAAIGVIIVTTQIYVMIGVTPEGSNPIILLMHFPTALLQTNPIILAFGLLALVMTVFLPMIKKTAFIPSTIVILLVVIPLSYYLHLENKFLINLPENIFHAMHFPDFSSILDPISLKYIIMFVLIGSIESLLTVCAIDSLAPQTAPSDLNRDLRAVGIGNLVSSLIGGLPMISEIIRSKANIDYGAKSARANFFHGLFMLIAVIFFPVVMNFIPLSALAALLVFVGLKLAAPKVFIHTYYAGKNQLMIFMVTFLTAIMVDILTGAAVGIVLKLFFLLARGHNIKQLFNLDITITDVSEGVRLEVSGPLTFINYLKLQKLIASLEQKTEHIILNIDTVVYMDYTVLQKIKTLCDEFKGIKITIEENQQLVKFYH